MVDAIFSSFCFETSEKKKNRSQDFADRLELIIFVVDSIFKPKIGVSGTA